MKKGMTYIALLLFCGMLVVSCSTRKAQCGAYALQDEVIELHDKSL